MKKKLFSRKATTRTGVRKLHCKITLNAIALLLNSQKGVGCIFKVPGWKKFPPPDDALIAFL